MFNLKNMFNLKQKPTPKTINKMLSRAAVLILSAVFLGGCALSPQYVDLKPTIDVKEQELTPNIVQLSIVDKRPETKLGTRGGVYKDTSYIYLSKPIEETLTPAAQAALQKLGLQTQGLSPLPYQMTIQLDKLTYKMNDEKLPKKVSIDTSISVFLSKGDKSHQGEFSSAKEFSYMKSPNEEENQKIINEILSDTLTRLFNDNKVVSFLSQ